MKTMGEIVHYRANPLPSLSSGGFERSGCEEQSCQPLSQLQLAVLLTRLKASCPSTPVESAFILMDISIRTTLDAHVYVNQQCSPGHKLFSRSKMA